MSAVAGRHGGYLTQFLTKPKYPRHWSRDVKQAVLSREAVERRLVLPLETKNWIRALEVLRSRYGRRGANAGHYQQVIRCIVDGVASHQRPGVVASLNTLRDQAYAGDIPSTGGLWVTLVWAYCELNAVAEGFECANQATRRSALSATTKSHIAELLLPQLAQAGRLHDLQYTIRHFLPPNSAPRAQKWVAEAAARSGDWIRALQEQTRTAPGSVELMRLSSSSGEGTQRSGLTSRERRSTAKGGALESLFSPEAPKGSHAATGSSSPQPQPSLGEAEGSNVALSAPALRGLLASSARDGRWDVALRCYSDLQLQRGGYGVADGHLHGLLDCLGRCRRWKDALAVFQREFSDSSSCSSLPPRALTPDAINLVFASFPSAPVCVELPPPPTQGSQVPALAKKGFMENYDAPEVVIRLLDSLLMTRDDMQMTDWVTAAAVPSLLQRGSWDRALHLLKNTPYFANTERRARGASGTPPCWEPTPRVVEERLLSCLLYLHTRCSREALYFTLANFTHAFPKAYLRQAPPPPTAETTTAMTGTSSPQKSTEVDVLRDMKWRERHATSVRPGRQQYFASRSASELTALQEEAMRANHIRIDAAKNAPFAGNTSAANKDPRPIPKGLHDTANGWNFYNRGGEMVFMNSRKTAHPFSMHPKVMRKLADPFRGWNPRENSVWAHRERVVKWNPNSAV